MDDLESLFESSFPTGGNSTPGQYTSQQPSVSSLSRWCSACNTLAKEMEDKYARNFVSLKQKIFSTDTLIQMYKTCEKKLEETTENLNQSHKDKGLIQAQLQLLLSQEEPSHSENIKLRAEIEKLKITVDNLRTELHGMDESRRIHEETIKILKTEGSGVVLEMKKKHKHQLTELREALSEKTTTNKSLTKSKKHLQQTVNRLRDMNRQAKSFSKNEVQYSDVRNRSILSESIFMNNNDSLFSLPEKSFNNTISMQSVEEVASSISDTSSLQDTVFESPQRIEPPIQKKQLKERVAYISNTTDDSADETKTVTERSNSTEHVQHDLPPATVASLTVSKQKTLKNRMLDIKRKRAYSSFKRQPTEPQLTDLLSIANGWRSIIIKKPSVRKAFAIDKLMAMISDYCEKHFLSNHEKLVLKKLCKLHLKIFSKRHQSWLEVTLQSAIGNDTSSTDSKHSSASENEINSAISECEEITAEKNISPIRKINGIGDFSENHVNKEILTNSGINATIDSEPIFYQTPEDTSITADMTVVTIDQPIDTEFISEMPHISAITPTIAINNDKTDIENVEKSFTDEKQKQSGSDSQSENSVIDSSNNVDDVILTPKSFGVTGGSSPVNENAVLDRQILEPDSVSMNVEKESGNLPSDNEFSESDDTDTALSNTMKHRENKTVTDNIVSPTNESEIELPDISSSIPSRIKRVSRFNTNRKDVSGVKYKMDKQLEDQATPNITEQLEVDAASLISAKNLNPNIESNSKMPEIEAPMQMDQPPKQDHISNMDVSNRTDDKVESSNAENSNEFGSQMPVIGDLSNDEEKSFDDQRSNSKMTSKFTSSSKKRAAPEDSIIVSDPLPKKQPKFQEPKILPVAHRRRTRSMTADSSSDQESLQNIPPSPIRRSHRISNRSRTSSESSESNVSQVSQHRKTTTSKAAEEKSTDTSSKVFVKKRKMKSNPFSKVVEKPPHIEIFSPPKVSYPLFAVNNQSPTASIAMPDLDNSNLKLIGKIPELPVPSGDDQIVDKISNSTIKKHKHSRVDKILAKMMRVIGRAISPLRISPKLKEDFQDTVSESDSSEAMDPDCVVTSKEDLVPRDIQETSKGRDSISPSTTLCTAISFGTPKKDFKKGGNGPLNDSAPAKKSETKVIALESSPGFRDDNISASSDELLSSDTPSTSQNFFSSAGIANDILKPRRFSCEAPEKAVTVLPIKAMAKGTSLDIGQAPIALTKNNDLRKTLSLPLHRNEGDIPSHWHASVPHNIIDHSNDRCLQEFGSNDELEINTDDENLDDQPLSTDQENLSDKETMKNVETPSDFDAEFWLNGMSNVSPLLTTIDSESDACVNTENTVKTLVTDEIANEEMEETNLDDVIEGSGECKNESDSTDMDTIVAPSCDHSTTEDEGDLIMDFSDTEEKQKHPKKAGNPEAVEATQPITKIIEGNITEDKKEIIAQPIKSAENVDNLEPNIITQQLSEKDDDISVTTLTKVNENVTPTKQIVAKIKTNLTQTEDFTEKQDGANKNVETVAASPDKQNGSCSEDNKQKKIIPKRKPNKKQTDELHADDNTGKIIKVCDSTKDSVTVECTSADVSNEKNCARISPQSAENISDSVLEQDSISCEDSPEKNNVPTSDAKMQSSKQQKAKLRKTRQSKAASISVVSSGESDVEGHHADKENLSSTKNKKNVTIKMKPFKRKKAGNRKSVPVPDLPHTLSTGDLHDNESDKLTIKNLCNVNTLILRLGRKKKVDVRFDDQFLPQCIVRFLRRSKSEFDIFSIIENDSGELSVGDFPAHEREFISQMHLIQSTGVHEGNFISKMVLPLMLKIYKSFGYGTPIDIRLATDVERNLCAILQPIMAKEKNNVIGLTKSCSFVRVFGMLCKTTNSLSSMCALCRYCLKWHRSVILFPLVQAMLCWPDSFKTYPTLGKSIHRILRLQAGKNNIIGDCTKAKRVMTQIDWLNSQSGWETSAPVNTTFTNAESLKDSLSRIMSAKFCKEFETFLVCEANNAEGTTSSIPIFDTETMIGIYILELLPKEGIIDRFKQEVLDTNFWPILNSWSRHLHDHGDTEEGKIVSDAAVSALLYALSLIFSSYMMRQRQTHKEQTTTPQLQMHFKVICSLMEQLSTLYINKAPRLVQCATASFLLRTAFCNPQNAHHSLLTWVRATKSTNTTGKRHGNTELLIAMSGCDEQVLKNICIWLDSKCGSPTECLLSGLWPS